MDLNAGGGEITFQGLPAERCQSDLNYPKNRGQLKVHGDGRRGVQTAAFNLPNDERVREAKGSKKVLLKNVMQAKFDSTGKPMTLSKEPKTAPTKRCPSP